MLLTRLRWHQACVRVVAVLSVMMLLSCSTEPEHGQTPQDPTGALRDSPQVAVLINSSAPRDDLLGASFCGAVLVSPTVVITARHCVEGRTAELVDVVINVDNLCRTAPIVGERIRATAFRVAPDRSLDLAAITLSTAAKTPPAEVTSAEQNSDRSWVAVGWGRDKPIDRQPCVKRAVPLERATQADCDGARKRAPKMSNPAQLCARPTEGAQRNTCGGDSGSPVLTKTSDNRTAALAVVSWGPGCQVGAVGFYSPIANFVQHNKPQAGRHSPHDS